MKKVLIVCSFLMIAVIGISCKTGEKVTVSSESLIAHQQAVKVLEEGNFVIEADEFFIPAMESDEPIRSSTRSFISLENGKANIKIYPEVATPNMTWSNMEAVGTGTIQFQKMNKRNGEMKYVLDIVDNNENWKNLKGILVLYKESNKCYLQLFRKNYGDKVVSINGRVCKYQ